MHVFKANDYTGNKKLGLFLCEALLLIVMISQIASRYQICHQINILKVGKCVEHVDKKRMLQL